MFNTIFLIQKHQTRVQQGDALRKLHAEMVTELKWTFRAVREDTECPDREMKLSRCIRDHGRLVTSLNTMQKRENIQKRGYDSSAYIAKLEGVKKEETHQLAKLGSDIQEECNVEDKNELIHLHPEIEQFEEKLPEPPEKVKTVKNRHKEKAAPSIIYRPEGFRPYGSMRELFESHEPLKIVGGGYDAGKTFSCIAYMDMLARRYPGARLTFIHKYLNRTYRNIIPSYEKYLGFRPSPSGDPNPTPITQYGGELPLFFEYWNGSRIYMNGLDKPDKLLSDSFDAAFINQVELISFESWNELIARVSERTGALPIAFLIADCNPNIPNHWIRQQTKEGTIQYFELSYRDNPEIYNQETGELTESGKHRVGRLQKLQGIRYKRGYEGKWEGSEGLVFENFSPDIHIIDNFEIDRSWKRYISVDWGFRNPASCIWWALSPDDRLYAYKEIYKTGLTKPEFIDMIDKNCNDGESRIFYAAVDSADQEGVSQLKRARFNVKEPKKSRADQIDCILERLKVDETGQPAIFFFRKRLVHPPDPELKQSYRSLEVTDEFLSCTYVEEMRGTGKDDEAIVGDHHGIDSTSYLIMSLKQFRTIGTGKVIHADPRAQ